VHVQQLSAVPEDRVESSVRGSDRYPRGDGIGDSLQRIAAWRASENRPSAFALIARRPDHCRVAFSGSIEASLLLRQGTHNGADQARR